MTARPPLTLRIFVSSPGDVGEERWRALAVLERLAAADWAGGRLKIEPVLWDDPRDPVPMDAGRSPQDSVDDYKQPSSECDLTVVILALRFGSPAVRAGGRHIRSGTEAEFQAAVDAGKPVFVYRSARALTLKPGAKGREQAEALEQFRSVERFFETRFQNAQGELTGGFTDYDGADDFERRLEGHLQAFARRRLDEFLKPYGVPGADDPRVFVGRDAELARLKALVLAGRHACIHQTPGIGKSTVALELVRDRADVLRHFGGALWLALGQQPALQMQRQLEDWARALDVDEALRPTLATLDDWKDAIASKIGTRRLLIVLDDVWKAEHAVEIMQMAPKAVFVVTTRDIDVAGGLDDFGPDQLIGLNDLDPDSALALLKHHAPAAVETLPERARSFVARVGGLPLALELMGKYLHRESISGNPDFIAAAFDALEAADEQMKLRRRRRRAAPARQEGDTLEEIIELSWKALESKDLRDAFSALAVFRPKPYRFTKAMAAAVWDPNDASDGAAAVKRLRALVNVGLVGWRDGEYEIHPIIHSFGHRKLSAQRLATLRRRVLAWLGREVSGLIARQGSDLYAQWYRYERADWQNAKDHWLYYLAVSGDRQGSMLAFLRVYFDAFWWWGFFEPFAFCNRLVEDWRRRGVDDRQREGLDLLRSFAEHYPHGLGRRGSVAQWNACEGVLDEIRRRIGLDQAEGEDAAQVRGITDFLLAECEAYGRNDVDAAIRRLEGAQASFIARRETWISAYLAFYLAQFELAAGRAGKAQAHVERGFELAAAQRDDPEVLSCLHRTQAEIELQAGALAAATASFRRAAAYAFAYQAVPEAADSYTVRYFEDAADRICERILALWRDQPGEALQLAEAMHTLWQPWWRGHAPPAGAVDHKLALVENDPGLLRRSLFPAMPPLEPREGLVGFSREVLAVLDEVCLAAGIGRPQAGG